MTAKQNFKTLLDHRLVEPFLEYARSQGVRLGNLIVKRAYLRLEAGKPLTLRQQVAARLAEEYLALQKATSPTPQKTNGHRIPSAFPKDAYEQPIAVVLD